MKGNAIKIWVVLVLAVCIWWSGVESHTFGSPSTGNFSALNSKFGAPNYPIVQFDARTVDELAYGQMIARLRQLLAGGYSHGIQVLRDPSSVPHTGRYILLEITGANGQPVTFAIDVTNVYIIGYRVGNRRFFFEEAPPDAAMHLFTDVTTPIPPRRSSNYQSLESRAGARRTSISLGLNTLAAAIKTLTEKPEDARSIIVVLQMVAEAVRYWEIETRVRRSGSGSFLPDTHMVDLENSWQDLSEQIQLSDNLAFERPITIGDMVAENVNSYVIYGLFLMMFVCDPKSAAVPLDVEPHLQLMRSDDLEAPQTCKHLSSPRARIRGRDGLCVDVNDFVYWDNNPVVVAACRSKDFKNQLWTFLRDGRIVSLQKCLAASGGTPGSSVVIHECNTLDAAAVQWVMSDSGTLRNRGSSLALTATSGSTGSKLTLEADASSTFQAWKSTNSVAAVNVYIQGEKNQCVYYNGGSGVYTEECKKNTERQLWRLYPDSTIRPVQWLDGCLELNSLTRNYNYIQAGKCGVYPDYHRWVFTRNGAIMNLKSKLVVDADKNGYLQAAPFRGGQNQIWTLSFVTPK